MMRAFTSGLSLALLSGFISILPAANADEAKKETSLCQSGEQVIFTCAAKKKWISVCAKTQAPQSIQYRYGTPAKVELAIPSKGVENVKYAQIVLSGGGGAYVRFTNDGTDYVVFSQSSRDGEKAGVVVGKGVKKLRQINCTQGGDVDLGALQKMKLPEDQGDGPEID